MLDEQLAVLKSILIFLNLAFVVTEYTKNCKNY